MAYIAHLILNVSDYKTSTAFYDGLTDILNIKSRIVHESEDVKIKAYQIPGCPIYLRWSKEEDKNDFVRNVGLDHLCIGVESTEIIDEVYQYLHSSH